MSHSRNGIHPTIQRDTDQFRNWQRYFAHHLCGYPYAFRLLMDGSIREMTVPEENPSWFDASYDPGEQDTARLA